VGNELNIVAMDCREAPSRDSYFTKVAASSCFSQPLFPRQIEKPRERQNMMLSKPVKSNIYMAFCESGSDSRKILIDRNKIMN